MRRVLFLLFSLIACNFTSHSEVVDNPIGNAGCFISRGKTVLLVEDFNDELAFPGGTAEVGESARDTAARETLEETGIAVAVGNLLYHFENGFFLFACSPRSSLHNVIAVPASGVNEVKALVFVPCSELSMKNWRFPEQFPPVPPLCEKVSNTGL